MAKLSGASSERPVSSSGLIKVANLPSSDDDVAVAPHNERSLVWSKSFTFEYLLWISELLRLKEPN